MGFSQDAFAPFISIGYGSFVSVEKIVPILSFGSSPTKRLKDEAQKNGKLLDATQGEKARTLIVTTSDHIILSAIATETLHQRLESPIKRES